MAEDSIQAERAEASPGSFSEVQVLTSSGTVSQAQVLAPMCPLDLANHRLRERSMQDYTPRSSLSFSLSTCR